MPETSVHDPLPLQLPLWERPSRFELLSVNDLMQLPDPAWLIDGVLPQDGLAVLYGSPGAGKSFLALDWACSIAAGRSWLGDHPVKGGPVIYVCGEGATGYKKRVAAWQITHESLQDKQIKFLRVPIDIPNKEQVEELVAAIRSKGLVEPALVVIDTLARCFGGGDENVAKDMNAFIQGADLIRQKFPLATVLVVHHSGKDGDRGARGSTALRGACDTELKLRGSGYGKNSIALECKKQKDAEAFKTIELKRRQALLSDSPLGETSCVIERTNQVGGGEAERSTAPDNENDKKALIALATEWINGMTHQEWLTASGLPKGTFKHVRNRLVGGEWVKRDQESGKYRATDKFQEVPPKKNGS